MNLKLFPVLMCVLFLAACGRDPAHIVGTLERDRLELVAEASEPVIEIAHREGQLVRAGDVLLRIDSSAMQARLAEAQAAQELAEHRLAELLNGARVQEISEARAAVAAAQTTRETDEREYGRIADLVGQKLLSQSALDQARARRDASTAAHRQAAARLDLLLEGTRREQVEQAEATLRQRQAALAQLQTSAARYSITAPRDGYVEALPYEVGERPPSGAPLVIMLADGVPYARVYIPETERVNFPAGREVSVRVDGTDREYRGTVRFVSSEAAFTPYYALTQEDRTRLSYLAEIDLIDPAARELPNGIPVQVVLPSDRG